MKDKTKIYIDLSKCTEEERKHIFSLLPECCGNGQYVYNDRFAKHLRYNSYHQSWVTGLYSNDKRLKELTYPEFIKLFEGAEDDNNGWIKIESEADLPKEAGDYWAVWKDGEVARKQFFCGAIKNIYSPNGNISEYDWWLRHITHYQPIVKPEPPKF